MSRAKFVTCDSIFTPWMVQPESTALIDFGIICTSGQISALAYSLFWDLQESLNLQKMIVSFDKMGFSYIDATPVINLKPFSKLFSRVYICFPHDCS